MGAEKSSSFYTKTETINITIPTIITATMMPAKSDKMATTNFNSPKQP